MGKDNKLVMRTLSGEDAESFKDIRLEALKGHPEAFLGCYEAESKEPISFFKQHINTDCVVGCFRENRLLGIAGYYIITPEGKRAHSAKIWGFYIRPEYRGRGFAKNYFKKSWKKQKKKPRKYCSKFTAATNRQLSYIKRLDSRYTGLKKSHLKSTTHIMTTT